MQFSRPRCLRISLFGVLSALIPLMGQQQPAPQPPKPPNPFEQVPQAQEPKPPPPKPEPAKPATPGAPTPTTPGANPDRPATDTIESVNFRGARKVPQDTLRAMVFTKKGDAYDPESLHRDLVTLWNTARFDNIEWTREAGPNRLDRDVHRHGAAGGAHHQIRRAEIDHDVRSAGPVQRTPRRTDAGIDV